MAWSVPLGAARLARQFFANGVAGEDDVRSLRRKIRAEIARDAGNLLRGGCPTGPRRRPRRSARWPGSAEPRRPATAPGPADLELADLTKRIPDLIAMTDEELVALPGVSIDRAHQIVPGALVAEACMDIFDLRGWRSVRGHCREGVILERFDHLGFLGD